jgi:hypothetical protein
VIDFQLDGVFNHSNPLVLGNEIQQRFGEGRFTGVGPAADQNGLPVPDRLSELVGDPAATFQARLARRA